MVLSDFDLLFCIISKLTSVQPDKVIKKVAVRKSFLNFMSSDMTVSEPI